MSAEAADARDIEPAYDASIPYLRDIEEPRRACALSGRVIEPGELMEIAGFIAQSTWRGELVVGDGIITRSLFFDEGQLVAAESGAPEERLREVLVKHHLLTRDEVKACEAVLERGGLRFGEAVVELKLASRDAVFGWLAVQMEEIAFSVFRAEKGTFAFFRGYEESRLSFRRKQEVGKLVERALRDMADPTFFRSKIRAATDVPVKRDGRTNPASDPLGVYAAIDGTKNVAELARTVGASELDVTRALYQHVQTGHATVKSKPLETHEIVGIYNRAITVLLRELDAMDEGDVVRTELAQFADSSPERPAFVGSPADDGTLDAETIAERIDAIASPLSGDQLARWLYDYASYALFLARPHLERRYDGGGESPRISQQVADLLEPLASNVNVAMPPAAKAPRVTIPAPSPPSGLSRRFEDEAPRSSSTMRMRRVLIESIPGIDPSRTVRIAPFRGLGAESPDSVTVPTRSGGRSPASSAASTMNPSSWRDEPTLTRPRMNVPRPLKHPTQEKSRWEHARVPALVLAALLAGTGIGWAAHDVATGTAGASPHEVAR